MTSWSNLSFDWLSYSGDLKPSLEISHIKSDYDDGWDLLIQPAPYQPPFQYLLSYVQLFIYQYWHVLIYCGYGASVSSDDDTVHCLPSTPSELHVHLQVTIQWYGNKYTYLVLPARTVCRFIYCDNCGIILHECYSRRELE